MDTNIFYEDGLIKVTRTMFDAGSTQFPIRNIGSVQVILESPSRKGPIICIGVGVLLIAAAGLGLLLIAAGIYWWTTQKIFIGLR